jgi:hypothetical protein
VRCDMCACLRLWCRVAVCSLRYNSIDDEGAAAISRGLASVPQLQTLEYVFEVCASWWCRCGRGTLWRRTCGAGCECDVQSVWACDVGWLCVCGATCVCTCACGVVWPCAAWAGTV